MHNEAPTVKKASTIRGVFGLIACAMLAACGGGDHASATASAARAASAPSTDSAVASPTVVTFGISGPPEISGTDLVANTPGTVPMCGLRDPRDVEKGSAGPLPSSPISNVELPQAFDSFQMVPGTPDKIYVKQWTGFRIYDAASKQLLNSFQFVIPSTFNLAGNFAVDPQGNVYIATQLGGIYKFDQTGRELLHITVDEPLDMGIYGFGTGGDFRVGAMYRPMPGQPAKSHVYKSDGTRMPDNNVSGYFVHAERATGNILVGDGNYVRMFDPTGTTQLFYMGTDLAPNDNGPFHFYVGGGLDRLPDGRFVVIDKYRGIMLFTAQGAFIGSTGGDPYAQGQGAIKYVWRGATDLQLANGRLYYMSAQSQDIPELSSVSIDTVVQVASGPQGTAPTLGVGAGLYSTQANNFFPAATPPDVKLKFYPWWSTQGNKFTGRYTVRSLEQIRANKMTTEMPFLINVQPTAVTDIPLALPPAVPGFYEVDVKLYDGSNVVGSDCLRYAVGAPGVDFNGSNNSSDVVTAAMMGQKAVRLSIGFDGLLPADPASMDPLDFRAADASIQSAAAEAAKLGVTIEVQIANGSEKEKQLVWTGNWQRRVQEVVTHFKPYVHAWEPWNEPNNTLSGDPAYFVNMVQKPFYKAVKAADPTATVIGGGILDVSAGYWQGIANAGGLAFMDAAGIHTYTGHNRSYEEQASINELKAIQAIFAASGKPGMEIWDTESGFWNSLNLSYYNQGDKIVRKQILQRSIGIIKYANFFNAGGYQVDGASWSLIGGPTGSITPGGLASTIFKKKLWNRPFLGWLTSDVPHLYAAEFGSSGGADTQHVVAVWADDFTVNTHVATSTSPTVQFTRGYGIEGTAKKIDVVVVDGSVTYFDVPAGQTFSIVADQSYGPNVAAARNGGVATASSSAPDQTPDRAIDGNLTMNNQGNNNSAASLWIASYTDKDPWLMVTLAQPTTVSRVFVSSQDINSVQTGLRNFDVQVDDGSGVFKTVAQVKNAYFRRNHLLSFTAQKVLKIRLRNMTVNYSGWGDGAQPIFWPDPLRETTDSMWTGQKTVYELEAY